MNRGGFTLHVQQEKKKVLQAALWKFQCMRKKGEGELG